MSSVTAAGWQFTGAIVLVMLLLAAAWVDVRQRRIPNMLVFSGLALALILAHLPGGSVVRCLIGVTVGIGMTLPLYWLRAMGAGDVKLMGMVGAFLGGADAFWAVLVIFIVGGLFGLVTVARQRRFGELAGTLRQVVLPGSTPAAAMTAAVPASPVGVLPYGVAIATGTIVYLVLFKGGVFQ